MRAYTLTLMAIASVVVATAAILFPEVSSAHQDLSEDPHVHYPAAAWDLWQLVQPSIH